MKHSVLCQQHCCIAACVVLVGTETHRLVSSHDPSHVLSCVPSHVLDTQPLQQQVQCKVRSRVTDHNQITCSTGISLRMLHLLSCIQGHDSVAVRRFTILEQQAISLANNLMPQDVLERSLVQAAIACQLLSTQSITKAEADMWQPIASEQAISDGQPVSTVSPVQPAAEVHSQQDTLHYVESDLPTTKASTGECHSVSTAEAHGSNRGSQTNPDSMQPTGVASSGAQSTGPHVSANTSSLQDAIGAESESVRHLAAQPEAFGHTEGQAGFQEWMTLFTQAYLPAEAQEMRSADDAALHLALVGSPGNSEPQPAEPSEAPLELPSWLAAFMEAHLHGPASSMQHAGSHQACEGSEASSAETEVQSVASVDDQSIDDSGDELDADYDSGKSDVNTDSDESDVDSDDEASSDSDLDPCPLALQNQLCCNLKGKVLRLASTALGLGYYAAGAACGSVLGLRQGMRMSSG